MREEAVQAALSGGDDADAGAGGDDVGGAGGDNANSVAEAASGTTTSPTSYATSLPADLLRAPKVFLDDIRREVALASKQERVKAYADVYGQKPPEELLMEECVEALGRALDEIFPLEQKSSLLKAQAAFPWLIRSSHAKTFLRAADFDVECAARRMVKYWESRERIYGDSAFSPGAVGYNASEDSGYLTSYHKSMSAMRNPNADRETKEIAKGFIHCWNETAMARLDRELNKIPIDEKTGYIEAIKKIPELVASDKHRLPFLRSDDFHAARAARRMVNYWNLRVDTFGADAFNDITIHSLENEGLRELETGFWCLLSGTDAYGRALISFTPKRLSVPGLSFNGQRKALWYVIHAAIEDEEIRKNGMVLVVFLSDVTPEDIKFSWPIASKHIYPSLFSAPANVRAIHACNPPGIWFEYSVQAANAESMGKDMRKRRVIHMGTREQVIAELEQCGISLDQIPVEMGGNFDYESVRSWIDMRRESGL